jgi:hypothetical protein
MADQSIRARRSASAANGDAERGIIAPVLRGKLVPGILWDDCSIVLPRQALQFGYLYRPEGAEGLSPGFQPWEPISPAESPEGASDRMR